MAGLLKKVFGVFGGGGEGRKDRSRRSSEDSTQGSVSSSSEPAPVEPSVCPETGKPRLPGGFGVRMAVARESPGPVLSESLLSTGGIQGLRWYCRSLHKDEEGDVATEFYAESHVSTTGASCHCADAGCEAATPVFKRHVEGVSSTGHEKAVESTQNCDKRRDRSAAAGGGGGGVSMDVKGKVRSGCLGRGLSRILTPRPRPLKLPADYANILKVANGNVSWRST